MRRRAGVLGNASWSAIPSGDPTDRQHLWVWKTARPVVNLPLILHKKFNWNTGIAAAATSLQNLIVIKIAHREIKHKYGRG